MPPVFICVHVQYFSDVRDRGQPEGEIGEDGGDSAEEGKMGHEEEWRRRIF
jgi:hypothetical protein